MKIAHFDTSFSRTDINYQEGYILDDTGTFKSVNPYHGDMSISCLKQGLGPELADKVEIIPVKSSQLNPRKIVELFAKLIAQKVDIFNFNFLDDLQMYDWMEIATNIYGQDIILTAAAGNNTQFRDLPIEDRELLVIGGYDKEEKPAWFSNYGPDMWCLGKGYAQTEYGYYQGTSCAAPWACGIIAQFLDRYKDRNAALDAAERGCYDIGTAGKDVKSGWGILRPPADEIIYPWRQVEIRRNSSKILIRFVTDPGVKVTAMVGPESVESKHWERYINGERVWIHRAWLPSIDYVVKLSTTDGPAEVFKV